MDVLNIDTAELALLPVDPDGSAATIRAGLATLLGVRVGIVITDTMGRAWRNWTFRCRHRRRRAHGPARLRRATDPHGNELVVTEIAVADELAAAADLVKGKLTGIPVAVVRGLRFPMTLQRAHLGPQRRG